jgi:hypothetical protein
MVNMFGRSDKFASSFASTIILGSGTRGPHDHFFLLTTLESLDSMLIRLVWSGHLFFGRRQYSYFWFRTSSGPCPYTFYFQRHF